MYDKQTNIRSYPAVSKEELDIMIDLIYDKYRDIHGNYVRLAELVSKEFKIQITERDIWKHFEPDITTEELDKVILLRNIGYYDDYEFI